LYDELRRVARRYIRDDRAENKLQTMALVNEVYLRLLDVKNVDWKQTCRVALFWRVDRTGIAEVLKISPRTIRRDWEFAKSWLIREPSQ
jgi:hypothetical protein